MITTFDNLTILIIQHIVSEKTVSSKKSARSTEVTKPTEKTTASQPDNTKQADTAAVKRGFPFLGLLNLLLIIGLMAAAFYYWQMQQDSEAQNQALLLQLQTRIDKKVDLTQIQAKVQAIFDGCFLFPVF